MFFKMLFCFYNICDSVEGMWSVIVKTSDLENAGTLAKVSLSMYGEKSNSGQIELKCDDPQPFERGKESTFTVRFAAYCVLSFYNIYN